MTAKVPANYKKEVTRATNSYYLSVGLLLAFPIIFACTCIVFLLANRFLEALYFGLFFLLMIWLFTGPLITSYAYSYLYRCLFNQDVIRLESIASNSIRLLDRLPVNRATSKPALLSLLGTARLEQGDYKSAEIDYREALHLAQQFHRGRNQRWTPGVVVLCYNLAVACLRQNNFVEADLLLEQGFELLTKANSPGLRLYPAFLHLAASAVRYGLNELPESEQHAQKALEIIQTAPGKSQLGPAKMGLMTQTILQLGLLYSRKGDLVKSNELCDQIINDCPSPLSTMSLKWLNLLASEYMNRQDFDRSQRIILMAYERARDCPFHPDARKTLDCFERQLLLTNRQSAVVDMRSWLLPIDN